MNDRMTNDDTIETSDQAPPGVDQPLRADFVPLARPVQIESNNDTWPPAISRLRALIELLILIPAGVIGLIVVAIPIGIINPADNRWYNVFSSVGLGLGTLAACVVMMLVGRHKPVSIGWTARNFLVNVGLGLAGAVALYAAVFMPLSLAFPQLAEQAEETQKAIKQTFPPMGIGGIIIMLSFVALWEEVIFRGFVLTRLQALFKRWWLTIPIASAIFGSIHGYEGYLAMIMITLLALVMSLLFVWRRSLVPSIVLHWLHNMATLLVLTQLTASWQ